ncbi:MULTISPECIES: hypothetical protein [unclassified Flavobacterium]|uniref:hypothetical protein n=1 Tax=unclassified Flavobacterium TaxID=196869 RepID=UPI000492F58F|nr:MULTISPECIES: hypothetical protein [unclassified Flavobacterium]MBF4493626.1 hypothetical protein [Flavobacterium sp. MR2016-29]
MIENYTFNETHTRFEPLNNKCTYCGEAEMKSINDCCFVSLYAINDRTNLIVYRSVKYAAITIGVPRCSSCKKIHISTQSKANWVSLGISAFVLVFIIYLFFGFNPFSIVFGLFGIFIGAVLLAPKLTETYTSNQGIYTMKDGAETNQFIHDLVMSGWSFTKPSA